jgi:preprotein translocase subunit SecF
MKNALVFNVISFVTFALAVFFLFSRGLHLSVEFTGGTLMEVSYSQSADLGKVRSTVAGLGSATLIVLKWRRRHTPPPPPPPPPPTPPVKSP